uniref:Uncharacterized protein n=1 Tax=Anopheles albimanus TaxID=7167 RepID=A0A182F1L6_ANOAL
MLTMAGSSIDFIDSINLARLHSPTNRYKDNEFDVTRKDGILLLRELASEVKNFMDFKMNAVMVAPGVYLDFSSVLGNFCGALRTRLQV